MNTSVHEHEQDVSVQAACIAEATRMMMILSLQLREGKHISWTAFRPAGLHALGKHGLTHPARERNLSGFSGNEALTP